MDGISEALNTTFVSSEKSKVVSIDTELKTLGTKKKKYEDHRLTMEDKEYLTIELKELIESTQEVRRILEENLKKPPHKASDVEAYSMVIGQITTLVRELRILNTDVVTTEIAQRKLDFKTETPNIGTQNNNVFLLDSKTLSNMIKDASNTSQLNDVVVDFDNSVSNK
jgi:hypothetical protein